MLIWTFNKHAQWLPDMVLGDEKIDEPGVAFSWHLASSYFLSSHTFHWHLLHVLGTLVLFMPQCTYTFLSLSWISFGIQLKWLFLVDIFLHQH